MFELFDDSSWEKLRRTIFLCAFIVLVLHFTGVNIHLPAAVFKGARVIEREWVFCGCLIVTGYSLLKLWLGKVGLETMMPKDPTIQTLSPDALIAAYNESTATLERAISAALEVQLTPERIAIIEGSSKRLDQLELNIRGIRDVDINKSEERRTDPSYHIGRETLQATYFSNLFTIREHAKLQSIVDGPVALNRAIIAEHGNHEARLRALHELFASNEMRRFRLGTFNRIGLEFYLPVLVGIATIAACLFGAFGPGSAWTFRLFATISLWLASF